MVWQHIDPGQIVQDDSESTTSLYRDSGPRESGQLLLSVAADGVVVRFELSHVTPGRPDYLAEWSQGGGLRVGEVDAGERIGEFGPRYKMSPIIHYYRQPQPPVVAQLLEYFQRNAAAVEPPQREQIAAVLRKAVERAR